jgi:hypothetical protein
MTAGRTCMLRLRSRSPSQAHNEVIGAPPATRLARDLTRAESAIWRDWRTGGIGMSVTMGNRIGAGGRSS